MPKTKWVFDCAEHKEFGGLGWKLANMPAFDPLPGMAVAHDVLEHWPNDDSTTGELMALGAMLHVRGEDYYAHAGRMHIEPSYHFSGELGELMLKIQWGEWVALRQYPRSSAHTDDEWARDEIAEGIKLAKKHIKEEYNELYQLPSKAEWDNVRYWLTHGYNKARHRYHHINRYQLLDTFTEIESKANEALKYAEQGITQLHVNLKWESGMITDARHANLKIYSTENYGR